MENQFTIQVPKEHYYSKNYNHRARWMTYFYQMQLLQKYNAKKVLEIGPGHSWMKKIIADFGVIVETVDIDGALNPDYVAHINALPMAENTYDAVCAFEVLEHLPFVTLEVNLKEMARVSKKYIIISLPDHRHILFHIKFKVPFFKYKDFLFKIPTFKKHVFDGQHFWEIGKLGYSPTQVTNAIESFGFKVLEHFVPHDTQSNHYFVIEKKA